eukprot:13733357-Ditylum_brightwellii.AAC.1
MNVSQLHKHTQLLTRGSNDAAVYDFPSMNEYCIPPGESRKINTEIKIEHPCDFFGSVASQSGPSTKHGTTVSTCTIDRDYTGPIQ